MTTDEIYEEIIFIYKDTKDVFTDWKKIVKLNKQKPVVYIKKNKDNVYIGLYNKVIGSFFNPKTLDLSDKHYITSQNKFIQIYENKITYNKVPMTFKKMSRILNHHVFTDLENLFKKIYNIDKSISLRTNNYNVIKLKEIQGITLDNYINNIYKDLNLNSELLEKLKTLNINMIKLVRLLWTRFVNNKTISLILEGHRFNLKEDRLGNYYYIKEGQVSISWLMESDNKYNSGYNNNIDNYIINHLDPNSSLYKLIESGDKESVLLGRELFKEKNQKYWK